MKCLKLAHSPLVTALTLAIFTTALAVSGLLYDLDYRLTDSLYQTGDKSTQNIFIVGIDNYALEEFGAWPWSRDIIGDVLFTLNGDVETQPAAIGVDIIYAGETDSDADAWLVASAANADNIVMATTVEFTTKMVLNEDGSAYMDDFAVGSVNYPFDALLEATEIGHSNAMYDTDGVLRHHLWSVNTGEEDLLSLPYRLYALYCDYWDLTADFVPPMDSQGFWWVDYGGQPEDMYAYSVADILYGDYDPDQLAGAIVLIGPYEPGMSDHFLTAVDRATNMYGVEYLANITDAMLRDATKVELSNPVHWIGIFLLALGLSLLLRKQTMGWAALISALLAGGFVVGGCALYHVGYVLRPLMFLLVVLLCFGTTVVDHYVIEHVARKRISNTFQHYVDPAIVKELMDAGEEALSLGGRNVDVAVLFVDIRNFTAISQQYPPQQVVNLLNEYLTLTSRCIKAHGGTLDKFLGDGTMAFWGAPLPCKDPVYAACHAALDMVAQSHALNQRLMETYGATISFGVGVHYGPAIVGNIGAIDRLDYTAIGDTVNTSARLESTAPAGTVYISRLVADTLGDRATTTSLGTSIKLKGKDAFEVLILHTLEKNHEKEGL